MSKEKQKGGKKIDIIQILTILVAAIGFCGGVPFLWEQFTKTPLIEGRVIGIFSGEIITINEHGIFYAPYIHLVNRREYPVSIIEYEAEINLGSGYIPTERIYGMYNVDITEFPSETQIIRIPKLYDKLLSNKLNAITYGQSSSGFVFFGVKDLSVKGKEVISIKITCIDAFNNRYTFETYTKDMPPLGYLNEVAGIEITSIK
jgi:hypothetical protein